MLLVTKRESDVCGPGRPSKYRSEYCERVIKCGEAGKSLASFAAQIGVSRRTLHNWVQAHPDFADACDIANAHACSWYEDCLRRVARGEGGPGAATAAIFGVKNFGRSDFLDRQQVEHLASFHGKTITSDMTAKEAAERYRQLLG